MYNFLYQTTVFNFFMKVHSVSFLFSSLYVIPSTAVVVGCNVDAAAGDDDNDGCAYDDDDDDGGDDSVRSLLFLVVHNYCLRDSVPTVVMLQ